MIRLLVEGDYHSGEVLGLAHPDNWPPRKRKYAEIMWNWRRQRLREIGRVDIQIIGGDLNEGYGRKGTLGLLTTDIGEQAEWAEEAAREVRAAYRYITYGTPYHVEAFTKCEDAVAKALTGAKPRETWRLGPFHGVRLMDRHVVGRSDIPYGQGTPLFREWVRDQLTAVLEEYRAADLHTRHHVHYYFEVRNARGQAVTCPCWRLPTPQTGEGSTYPYTLRPQYYDVGFLLIEIDRSGEIYVRPQIMPLKIAISRSYVCPRIKENS
jgi:hypothetical protein